jgi:plastocyanin
VRGKIALAGVAVGVAALAPGALSEARPAKQVKKTIRIGDNFFAPKSLRVPRNTKITWRWPSNPGDVHDVYLRSGPRGVKKFHSELAATGYSFARTLAKPGLYRIICTIHAEMRMTVRVRR